MVPGRSPEPSPQRYPRCNPARYQPHRRLPRGLIAGSALAQKLLQLFDEPRAGGWSCRLLGVLLLAVPDVFQRVRILGNCFLDPSLEGLSLEAKWFER